MSILFRFRNKNYSLDIGRTTAWFSQIYLICLTRIIYKDLDVVWAEIVWSLGGKIDENAT